MATSVLCEKSVQNPYSVMKQEYPNSTKKAFPENINKPFQDVSVVKQLNKAKFPVYLVSSNVNKQSYAMKIFPHEKGHPHPYYKNEIRFAGLSHPNVIRNYYFENERKTKSKGIVQMVSYKIMEFAPYGDFFDLVMKHSNQIDEKLARTYFRQMIEGLEYLHFYGVSHMDLKLENLLLGEDFNLKICDFDLSFIEGDSKIMSKGTKFYRAPEVMQARCKNTKAADIYSAGIVLFTFKSRGILPHAENNLVKGVNFSDLLHNDEEQFWEMHCEVQGKDESFFNEDFKELFMSMTRLNPEKRASIEEIKKSKWYNGPVYSQEELKAKLGRVFKH